MTKRAQAYRGYARSYNIKILNSFNPELHLKDTKFVMKNKLIALLTELKKF